MKYLKPFITADLFCGAGGASTGIQRAVDKIGRKNINYCINHWDVAIETHSANHPKDHHLCAPIESVIPSEFVKEGYLDLLWASPSCTHHSRAKGGKPRNNQLRAQPNLVLDWLDMLFVKRIIIENVWEFTDWGPLNMDGTPIKSKRGECFRQWLQCLAARNYTFEYRKLNCADYGDCTTRERSFLQAIRKGHGKIKWPEPTPEKNPQASLFGERKKWRGIGECLDTQNIGTPLSERKKPLARATMLRIEEGLRKFYGERFVVDFIGTDNPTANCRLIPLSKPLTTQHCANRYGLATPIVFDYLRNGSATGIEEPIRTQHCKDRFALVTPFIVKLEKGKTPTGIDEPISVQTSCGKFCLVNPIVLDTANGGRTRGPDEPMTTLTTKNSMCVATPIAQDGRIVDVAFRMLTSSELKQATGFGKDYKLCGNVSQQVKQIGNAVPVNTASALAKCALENS